MLNKHDEVIALQAEVGQLREERDCAKRDARQAIELWQQVSADTNRLMAEASSEILTLKADREALSKVREAAAAWLACGCKVGSLIVSAEAVLIETLAGRGPAK